MSEHRVHCILDANVNYPPLKGWEECLFDR